MLPGSLREDLVHAKATEILAAIANFRGTPNDSAVLSSLAQDMHTLVNKHPSEPVQRVSAEQRVPKPAPTPTLPPPDTSPVHPTESRARARRARMRAQTQDKNRTAAGITAATQYVRVPKSKQRAKDRVFNEYVGRCYTDSDDGKKFQITKIVFPREFKKDKFFIPYFKYYDMSLHPTPPSHETDYEHTPCREMIRWDRKIKKFC